ncbi:MAG: heavy-metal-associated domain-containing protein [Ignavibacteria bacterium]|jgi:copper ion binding protein|nr:heavy-metal-associated domain-containing protein [Ignavibacteria bacterium]
MKSVKIITLLSLSIFVITGLGGKTLAENKIMTENEQTLLKGTIKKVKFKCKGIGCTGCTNTITDAVKKLEGIKEVTADVKSKIVKVSFDSEIVSAKEIENAINNSGYETEAVN